jgi:ubiquinol-cytochrome c reductase cytochrome b subunit
MTADVRASTGEAAAPRGSWTAWLRTRLSTLVPPGQVLPDRQPAYVASWIYVFGVLTLASLVVVLVSGAWLAVGGATWWHTSSLGHYVNSLHLWSVELFFACMVIHLWGKFWMAAWRGKRTLTWVTGVIAFVASKDGLNAIGVGAWFNVLNPGQMLLWHVVLLPFAVGVIAVWHVVLVRRHGVVPPIDAEQGE